MRDSKRIEQEAIAALTPEQYARAAEILKKEIPPEDLSFVRNEIKKNPSEWIGPYHFGWGMAVRNILRKNNFTDKESKSGNLDDIYVALIEHIVKEDHGSFERL